MKEILLEVYTPTKSVFSGIVKSLSVPGESGAFQVLFNHAPIISSLEIGPVKIEDKDGKISQYATSGGTVEVMDNKILILAETFEPAEHIDTDRAKKSIQRAKDRLSIKSNPDIDRIRAEVSLKRAINRLKIADLK